VFHDVNHTNADTRAIKGSPDLIAAIIPDGKVLILCAGSAVAGRQRVVGVAWVGESAAYSEQGCTNCDE